MENIKEHKGTLGLDLIDKFREPFPFSSFTAYVLNNVDIEGAISVAGMLFPQLV